MEIFTIQSNKKEELIDITTQIQEAVKSERIENGICLVYVPHTTAGVTINENADPAVKADLLMALGNMVLDTWPYAHAEGNSPAHTKSTLVGSSVSIIIEKGELMLGTWQGIFFCEFDGPRRRKVLVRVLS